MNGTNLSTPTSTMGSIGKLVFFLITDLTISISDKKKDFVLMMCLWTLGCRCGFAQSQEAYDSASKALFSSLDRVDEHLKGSRYLCGDKLTLADVCLFTTLIRFDLVYNVLFKCTKKKLIEYQHIHGYFRDIYQVHIYTYRASL